MTSPPEPESFENSVGDTYFGPPIQIAQSAEDYFDLRHPAVDKSLWSSFSFDFVIFRAFLQAPKYGHFSFLRLKPIGDYDVPPQPPIPLLQSCMTSNFEYFATILSFLKVIWSDENRQGDFSEDQFRNRELIKVNPWIVLDNCILVLVLSMHCLVLATRQSQSRMIQT